MAVRTSTKNKLGYMKVLQIIALVFAVVSIIYAITEGQADDILLSVVTLLLIMAPAVLSKWFGLALSPVVFTFFVLYALGPILGTLYKLYYLTSWWDDLLHFCGGITFAALGYLVFDKLNRGKERTPVVAVAFAVFFSMAISVFWEFYEFACDRLLHTDMQMDTVITEISSYRFASGVGDYGHISGITDTAINGHSLGINGYLDIGLIDTMSDMLTETGGALLFGVYALIDKNRHPFFKNTKVKEKQRLAIKEREEL